MNTLLLAESGGTKTDWLLDGPAGSRTLQTVGLNPNVLPGQEIQRVLLDQVLPWLAGNQIHELHFFGAGMGQAANRTLIGELLQAALQPRFLQVETDLLAAARAGLGRKPGLTAILGTGSVSFRYDGTSIVERHGGWGYILGDEGSGSALGRTLIRRFLEKALPPHLCQAYREHLGLEEEDILQRVYRSNPPARFLAEQVPFLATHQEEPAIRSILDQQFATFFELYLRPFSPGGTESLVLFGGVARAFATILQGHYGPWFSRVEIPLSAPGPALLAWLRSRN
jgi:N-acetylglucosamine kinase-like BadF-type ATPase